MIINLKEHLYLLSIVTAMLVTSACSRSELFKAELACSKGDGKACVTAANIYKNGEDSTGKKIVADLDKARSFFIKACDNHEGSVCNEIGKELSSPNRKDVDFVAATEFFEKGCNVNNYEACTNLGVLYAGTNELRRNFDKSYQYFVKACSGQNARGCTLLGLMYEKGQGVVTNISKATSLYQRSCNNNDPQACVNLGLLYLQGSTGFVDNKKAFENF